MRSKDVRFARYGTTVIGLKIIRGNVSTSSRNGRKPANRNLRVPANGARRVKFAVAA